MSDTITVDVAHAYHLPISELTSSQKLESVCKELKQREKDRSRGTLVREAQFEYRNKVLGLLGDVELADLHDELEEAVSLELDADLFGGVS